MSNGQPISLDGSIVAPYANVLENPNMSDDAPVSPAYQAFMQLKPEKLSLGSWAAQAGLARNYFTNLRDHGNPGDETVRKLLQVIDVPRTEYEARLHPVRTEVSGLGLSTSAEVRREFFGEQEGSPLEVLGTAMGGEFGDLDADIEMTELHLHEVIDRVARPASLANDQQAYALRIVGDSMFPRFKPGERVAVSPKKPVQIGNDVIVQLRGSDGNDGERIQMVLIKELVRRTSTFIELRQYNPDMVFRVEARRVAHIHVVGGNYF
jgi:phage repressor protein C with HTH and peptisase S24 domain